MNDRSIDSMVMGAPETDLARSTRAAGEETGEGDALGGEILLGWEGVVNMVRGFVEFSSAFVSRKVGMFLCTTVDVVGTVSDRRGGKEE